MYNLFLDDIRYPRMVFNYINDTDYNKLSWVIVRSYDEFINYIKINKIPNLISFDHDISDEHYSPTNTHYEKTGYDALKWLCDYSLYNNLPLPKIKFHTANPIGKKNMITYLNNFQKHNKK